MNPEPEPTEDPVPRTLTNLRDPQLIKLFSTQDRRKNSSRVYFRPPNRVSSFLTSVRNLKNTPGGTNLEAVAEDSSDNETSDQPSEAPPRPPRNPTRQSMQP